MDAATKERFDELIAQGEKIEVEAEPPAELDSRATRLHRVDKVQFTIWCMSSKELLEDCLVEDSPHRFLVEKIPALEVGPETRDYLLHQLRTIRDELSQP